MARRTAVRPKDPRSDSPEPYPTPDEVRAARERAGLTQRQAATVVHTHWRVWQMWEAAEGGKSSRQMHPAFFELFTLKTGLRR